MSASKACLRHVTAAVAIVLMASANGQAQTLFGGKVPRGSAGAHQSRAIFDGSRVPAAPADARRWGSSPALDAPPLRPLPPARSFGSRPAGSRINKSAKRFLAGFALGTLGFFGGAFAGSAIAQPGGDDMLGVVIGAPIGAGIGALVGALAVK